MRVLFFGSYDAGRHPRVRVLAQGFRARGDEVVERNVPLGLGTARRVRLLGEPWRLPGFLVRLVWTWFRLFRAARDLPAPDAVVVGYLGHLDIHLARRLWPGVPLVLDYMAGPLAEIVKDRDVGFPLVGRVLEWVDRAAVRAADVVAVDTEEHAGMLPESGRASGVVVPVGAAEEWFSTRCAPPEHGPLRVVFFGLYTPLQGAPVIGDAIAQLAGDDMEFLMVGRGQDYETARERAGEASGVTWEDWIEPPALPERVAACHICLGIFGTSPKARRVVPNKVYQGAAAGCAVVTSDTPPQRSALGGAGIFVKPGDGGALARELRRLSREPGYLTGMRNAAAQRAEKAFRPERVITPLRERLPRRSKQGRDRG